MTKRIDLTGQRFGRLTVIRFSHTDKRYKVYWDCQCDCGNEKTIVSFNLTSGKTQSCGCLHKEVAAERLLKHGNDRIGKRTREYEIWVHMISRCENINDKSFPDYGGRNIKVCDNWRTSFEKFLEDMGERPTDKHSIDRIDVNGNYEPSNCRWATKEVQSRNTRVYKTNKTGVSGVYFNKKLNKYQARIAVNGKHIHLGCFLTLEEAANARRKAEEEYWKTS
ncbi:AP2 domain-containing protein [Neobacillus drentensis]|uniref:AP2 domain-containing protein n=1 Tax=Neobacillus drentensis TaxID=220684 RepID=UPI001F48C942|nr:AP2 domain-containing protein [Neobacillus drentensis]ULT55402.1 AP2 domain-containing protein [Neobacillus drentensis]